MAIAGTSEQYVFVGRYPQTADGQARVLVPKKWRPDGGKETFFFQVGKHDSLGKFLRVMPMEAAIRLRDKLDEVRKTTLQADDEMRLLGGHMDSAMLDSAGRLTLPDDLIKRVGIKKTEKVVLVGCLDRFEIWRAEDFEKISQPED